MKFTDIKPGTQLIVDLLGQKKITVICDYISDHKDGKKLASFGPTTYPSGLVGYTIYESTFEDQTKDIVKWLKPTDIEYDKEAAKNCELINMIFSSDNPDTIIKDVFLMMRGSSSDPAQWHETLGKNPKKQ